MTTLTVWRVNMTELVEVRTANNLINQTITLDLMQEWISFLDVKPKTAQTYTRNIKPFARFLQEVGIAQPTREDVISYREELKAEGKKPATVQAYLTAIKLFFQWTEIKGYYPNISKKVKGANIRREHKKDPLTVGQITKTLSNIDRSTETGKRDYAILSLMITSGLRTIEVIRANVEDLRTIGDFTALFLQGKGRDEKSEYVKVPSKVEEAIRIYLATREDLKENSPLFASEANRNKGDRLTTRSVSRVVKESLRAVNLDSSRLTAHSLRHTTATLNLLNGGTVEETQQLLRHSNINTTMIYNHALSRASNNSEARVAQAIFNT